MAGRNEEIRINKQNWLKCVVIEFLFFMKDVIEELIHAIYATRERNEWKAQMEIMEGAHN